DRVMRRLEVRRPDRLMALPADFRLVREERRHELVDRRGERLAVDAVTVAARHFVELVLAGCPEREVPVARVAGQANAGALVGGVTLAERIGGLGLRRIFQVRAGIAVAGLA